jgi:hypothetical protein
VDIEDVSTRLLESEIDAAGKSTTPDLNLGVISKEMTMEETNAMDVSKINNPFFFQAYFTRSNALLTNTLLDSFDFIIYLFAGYQIVVLFSFLHQDVSVIQ